jgi:dUTP pyrophosphatase
MIVKIKKVHEDVQIPEYAKDGDAGLDLVAISKTVTNDYVEYKTGLAMEIPEGHVGLVFPRSSLSKYDLQLCNSVGVIDSGYRGEILCRFNVIQNDPIQPNLFENIVGTVKRNSLTYEIGDKVAQIIIIPYPKVKFEEVKELTETERGEGGFGSTDSVPIPAQYD